MDDFVLIERPPFEVNTKITTTTVSGGILSPLIRLLFGSVTTVEVTTTAIPVMDAEIEDELNKLLLN